ncbi:hypothetical protein SteCoe_17386 [Stentor coeruleus]|uniref:Uncharacterized protein n=1 Tax=Stentor coeruleus TaxID=5963 RepID=A0A1R2BZ29_9CILI|nr:hypothetical protein SteCoe_17386 [Stentor coeruleus]
MFIKVSSNRKPRQSREFTTKEVPVDLQAENKVEQQVEVIEVKMPIDPVSVQSALRGHMARKEMTPQLKDYRNSKIFKPEEYLKSLTSH